jgi:hypothetical protein
LPPQPNKAIQVNDLDGFSFSEAADDFGRVNIVSTIMLNLSSNSRSAFDVVFGVSNDSSDGRRTIGSNPYRSASLFRHSFHSTENTVENPAICQTFWRAENPESWRKELLSPGERIFLQRLCTICERYGF